MNMRTVLAITGTDRVDFLQGLITNDVTRAEGGIVYAALLSLATDPWSCLVLVNNASLVISAQISPSAPRTNSRRGSPAQGLSWVIKSKLTLDFQPPEPPFGFSQSGLC